MKQLLTILFLTYFTSFQAQDTAVIKTSAMCNSCKNRLEARLEKVKGILSTNLEVESKLLTVIYDKSIIQLGIIEDKITEIGYDANKKMAKKAAYKRLPACCRKDYVGSH